MTKLSSLLAICALFLIGQIAEAKPKSKFKIEWDEPVVVAERGGYGRIIRLQDGGHMATYEVGGNTVVSRYDEENGTWGEPVIAVRSYEVDGVKVIASNAEITQLPDGSLIHAVNFRPKKDGVEPFSIAVTKSYDLGKTWEEPQIIYRAGKIFGDGCWEPSFLQLPDGTLHVYFANEAPYTSSSDQEISMLSSKDGGKTWADKIVTVCHRDGGRDGMPTAIIAGDQIILSVEDNKDGAKLKPWTIRTSLSDPWKEVVDGDSPYRRFVTTAYTGEKTYGGAPYLLKIDDEHTLISYQCDYERGSNWRCSNVEVVIGNGQAERFDGYHNPFDLPEDKGALWNSLNMWDEDTIVLVSTIRNDADGANSIVMTKGYIIRK